MKTIKFLLAGAVVATTMGAAVPASAVRLTFGPDGPGVDLRSRNQRIYDREMDRRDYYRQQRFRDRDRGYRRNYDY